MLRATRVARTGITARSKLTFALEDGRILRVTLGVATQSASPLTSAGCHRQKLRYALQQYSGSTQEAIMPPDDRAMFDEPGSESTIEADRTEEIVTSERDETISWIREQVATA